MTLGAEEGLLRLRSQWNNFELKPESPTGFQGQGPALIYRMDVDSDGSLILTKQGRATRWQKLKIAEEPGEAKLSKFAGRYACPELLAGWPYPSKMANFGWKMPRAKVGS